MRLPPPEYRVAFRALPVVLAALCVLFSPPIPGAPAGPQKPVDPRQKPSEMDDEGLERLVRLHHTEQEEVRIVLLPAVVTRNNGKLVRGLQADDFTLSEDTVPQEIRYFSTEASQPISIAFLLDVSGSMRQVGKLDEAKAAIRVFVDALHPGDQFGLICFADEQVAWITEFTSDRENFLRRLDVQRAYGQTALFDAVAAAPELVDSRIRGRKAIVLITDGNDNASRLNTFKATQLARKVNVPMYTIGFASLSAGFLPKGSVEPSLRILERFSDETGGTLFTVRDPDDLKEAVLTVQHELRFSYVIGYHPDRGHWDGEFRRVKLETNRRRLNVKTRSGYYATP